MKKSGALVALLAILGTWVVVYYMTLINVETWLVPWDLYRERPAIGTTERTINDYFESPPGSLWPAYLILALSVIAFAYQHLIKRVSLRRLSLEFMLSIVVYVFVGFSGMLIISPVGRVIGIVSQEIGYQRAWPGIVSSALGILLMLVMQSTLLGTKLLGKAD